MYPYSEVTEEFKREVDRKLSKVKPPPAGVSFTVVKRAWIRNQDIPAGQPAPGHISCPCGGAPESNFDPSNGDVICACGTVYTWNGWIKEQSE